MQTGKTFFAGLLCALVSLTAIAQTVRYPQVDSQYRSNYGTHDILGVMQDDAYTYIIIENITARGYANLTISISDNTTLSYPGRTLRIHSWGYWDGERIQDKDFNRQYSLQADRRYLYVLVFQAIPAGTKTISVRENVSNGFYWNGIHLDNPPPQEGHSQDNYGGFNENPRSFTPRPETFEPIASGTCFAISSNGYLATCYHVIESARKIRIRGVNGNFSALYKATVVGVDRNNDLAILKITDNAFTSISGIPYTISGKTSDVGEEVFVLGYPLRAVMGDEIKLTNGLISSKSGYQGDATAYQISATVQSGNSGGPLFDSDGNVIGVVNARLYVESAAYAVKSPYLKKLAESVESHISLPATNRLSGKSLKEKVKEINKFIYIIEVE